MGKLDGFLELIRFAEDGIDNVILPSKVKEHYAITIGNIKDKAFIVHKPGY